MEDLTKEILVELILKADDSIQQLKSFQGEVNKAKQAILELKETIGSSFEAIESIMKTTISQSVKEIKSEIEQLRQYINQLKGDIQETSLGDTTIDTSKEKIEVDVEQVKAAEVALADARESLQAILLEAKAVEEAFKQLKAEMDQLPQSIERSAEKVTTLTSNTANLAPKIRESASEMQTLSTLASEIKQQFAMLDMPKLSEGLKKATPDVEELKSRLESLRTAGNQSIESISNVFDTVLSTSIDNTERNLEQLRQQLKMLEEQLASIDVKELMPETTSGQALIQQYEQIKSEIAATENMILTWEGEMQKLLTIQEASTIAFKEMRSEAEQLSTPMEQTAQKIQVVGGSIEEAKMELLEMIQSGQSLNDAMDQLGTIGQYTVNQINQAAAQLKEAFNFGPKIRQVSEETSRLIERLNTLRTSSKEITLDNLDDGIPDARAAVTVLIEEFDRLQAKSGESVKIIENTIKEGLKNSLSSASTEVVKLSKEMNDLNTKIKAIKDVKIDIDLKPGDTLEGLEKELAKVETNLRKTESKLKDFQLLAKNIGAAFSEVRAQAKQIAEPIRDANDASKILEQNARQAALQILEMVNNGHSLTSAMAGVKQEGNYTGEVMARVREILKNTFNFGPKIRQITEEMHKMRSVAKIIESTLRGLGVSANTTSTIMGMLGSVFKGFGGSASSAASSASSASSAVSASGAAAASAGVPWAALAGMLAGTVVGAFKAVMNSIKRVARIVTGILISKAIMGMVQAFRDAVDEALKLNRALIDVATSVRQLQRTGVNTTIGEWIDLVNQLEEEFTQFSRSQIADAVKQMAILGRQSGASAEDIQTLAHQVLHLATVMGVDVITAANAFATAVESGYARGLKEVIGVIDEVTLAEQALAWGWVKSTEEVDGHMRMLVLLELARRKTAETAGDVEVVQESLSGKYNEVTQEIVDQKAAIGEDLLPAIVLLKEGFLSLLEGVESAIGGIKRFIATIYGVIAVIKVDIIPALEGFGAAISEFFANIGTAILNKILPPLGTLISHLNTLKKFGLLPEIKLIEEENLGTAIQALDSFKAAYEEMMRLLDPDSFDDLDEKIGNVGDSFEEAGEDVEDFTDLMEDLIDVVEDTNQKLIEAEDDFVHEFFQANAKLQQDLKQAEAKFHQDQQQAYEKYLQDQLQATQKYALDTKHAYEDYQLELVQLEREYEQEVEDINNEYRENEIKAERDYQEELRKLREQYLMDLEDALHERDARQVLRLMREYNLRKAQLARERRLEQEENEQKLEDELEQLEREKEAKLQAMQEEFELEQQQREENFQLAQQQRADDYALAAAQRAADYELARQQMVKDFALQQQLRLEDHKRRIEEIKKQGEERAQELVEAYAKEHEVTEEWADKIVELLTAYFGQGGPVDATLQGLITMIDTATIAAINSINALNAALAQIGAISTTIDDAVNDAPPGTPSNPGESIYPSYAEGGMHIANKPTTVTFGESGWEAAKFVPLGRQGRDVDKVFGELPMGASQDQFVRLMVDLSPDLEVRIVEKSIGTVADVMEGRIL
jgi:DNA repair exonuclease SbcCD ATPase subunit